MHTDVTEVPFAAEEFAYRWLNSDYRCECGGCTGPTEDKDRYAAPPSRGRVETGMALASEAGPLQPAKRRVTDTRQVAWSLLPVPAATAGWVSMGGVRERMPGDI
ncbi:hypothetical protein SAMN02745830_06798 [Streptomyces sp. Amel2xC10]|nr:hypothetical protein SAMN02745830_06798 [Streptomyces sp. Amel2xC10]